MASPQLENGYVKISNEIWDALCKIRIPGEAMQILQIIIRKTYGFNKKKVHIALNYFSLITGIDKKNINRNIKKLLNMNIIFKNEDEKGCIYGLQKDYAIWKSSSKMKTSSKMKITIFKNEDKPSSKMTPNKDTINKDTINKDKKNVKNFKNKLFDDASIEIILSKYLYNCILENDPKHKKPNFQKWATDFDKLIRIDKRDPTEIKNIIEWAQKDNFWKSNILSPTKLKKQYTALLLQKKRHEEPTIQEKYKNLIKWAEES